MFFTTRQHKQFVFSSIYATLVALLLAILGRGVSLGSWGSSLMGIARGKKTMGLLRSTGGAAKFSVMANI